VSGSKQNCSKKGNLFSGFVPKAATGGKGQLLLRIAGILMRLAYEFAGGSLRAGFCGDTSSWLFANP